MNAWRPRALAEALEIRRARPVIPFAGGTDLMVRYRPHGAGALPAFPQDVLFLDGIRGLRRIEADGEGVRIGARCTLADLSAAAQIPELLRRAANGMASPAVRARATLAGNICNASPAGDTLPPLYALGARLRLAGAAGERLVPIAEFITGPGRTALAPDELLTEVVIPRETFGIVYYRKVGARRANALAKVSVAALAALEGGRLRAVRVAVGAAAPTVARSRELERSLEGRPAGQVDIGEVQRGYDRLIRPIDDQRSTAAYRRQVALNLIGDFLRLVFLEMGRKADFTI